MAVSKSQSAGIGSKIRRKFPQLKRKLARSSSARPNPAEKHRLKGLSELNQGSWGKEAKKIRSSIRKRK